MIRIQQIKISIFEAGKDRQKEKKLLSAKAAAILGCRPSDVRKLKILRRSVDARDKDNILFVYTLQVRLHDSIVGPSSATEAVYISRLRKKQVTQETQLPFCPEQAAAMSISETRPVVIGTGPCGLFAALILAEAGRKPILLERGGPVDERTRRTERFFESGRLDPDCNVQFGEGGAGTFSDGKLNTSIKDPGGFIAYVLQTFVRFGADPEILYDQKPHVGTDVLAEILPRIRAHIESLGGEYRFYTRAESFTSENGQLTGIQCIDLKSRTSVYLPCSQVLLAIGHSARDTYTMLHDNGIPMEAKPFAVGVRVQHPQQLIDEAMYGKNRLSEKQEILGPSPYKLTHRAANGRNVFSFCMCPGGYVINSSSEEERLCINGMSMHDRDSGTANSALIVNVDPSDYQNDPLAGIEFQRKLEEDAYHAADGCIPYETYGEFAGEEAAPSGYGRFEGKFRGFAAAADLRKILPGFVTEALLDGMQAFGRQISGYDDPDVIISAIEARTSSPVRLLRDETRQCPLLCGLFPAGEGAGYAGGITSAAVDGIRSALAMLENTKLSGQ